MKSRVAGSALLHHLSPYVFGPAAPSAAAPTRPLLVRLLSVPATEAKPDVAEMIASKKKYAGIMSAKAEMAIISAAEARADVAEVYASKEEDSDWKGEEETEVSAAQANADVKPQVT